MSIISGGNSMKFFVTGVGGQLGHDVMNELIRSAVTKVSVLIFRSSTAVWQMVLR